MATDRVASSKAGVKGKAKAKPAPKAPAAKATVRRTSAGRVEVEQDAEFTQEQIDAAIAKAGGGRCKVDVRRLPSNRVRLVVEQRK